MLISFSNHNFYFRLICVFHLKETVKYFLWQMNSPFFTGSYCFGTTPFASLTPAARMREATCAARKTSLDQRSWLPCFWWKVRDPHQPPPHQPNLSPWLTTRANTSPPDWAGWKNSSFQLIRREDVCFAHSRIYSQGIYCLLGQLL